ncbi:TolC family protein [Bacteroides sp. 224]|uniref:TolC family protein n=1 Tax=Bacteroides sp. 224 TaxID=2302936 RepID=UPI0013D3181F|nr:TolC family protein [Bacteroides sp. 224]NDV65532.1 TolC family protein [Bacteroides sp. 224]
MKKLLLPFIFIGFISSLTAQTYLNLDSCRALAIANNKELLISQQKIKAAHYQKKAAFTNYLPSISGTAAYMRMQKEISLLNDDQKSALTHIGTSVNGSVQEFAQAIGTQFPDLQPLISSLGNSVVAPLNGVGNSLIDALRTDTRNMYVGAITLTQPLYMGGKIRAYNKITKYAEELAHQQHNTELQEVILNTDQAYWQVVSLTNKKKLAEAYRNLLQKMNSDIEKMVEEGVATRADALSVRVKLNEAEMTFTKVEDGLSLSRMLLCQLCGIPLTTPIVLNDEDIEDLSIKHPDDIQIELTSIYANRPEVQSLELGTKIHQQKINVTRSEHLPSVALIGNYMVSNPSLFNGFEKKFRGMWNVGVMLQIPIWHWGEGSYKVKAAKAEANIAQYQLNDVKEKIELQVNQAVFKVNEAAKKLIMADNNMDKANENLRYANLGFKEGVIPTSNVLEAQTAWLSAQSEKIDAQIDVKLTEIYLKKAMGSLGK